jgi:uncharacterized protein
LLVGILSDTHNDHLMAREAMRLFDHLGVAHLIHCGDVGGEAVFDELVGRPLTFVWGNTDCAANGTLVYIESIGFTLPSGVPTTVTLDGKRFAVFHGHERGFDTAIDDLDVDVICHGHTHVARDDLVRGTRIINPGALHRARRTTVASYDTETDRLQYFDIKVG